MNGKINEEEFKTCLSFLGVDFNYKYFSVIVMSIDNAAEILSSYEEEKYELLLIAVSHACVEISKKYDLNAEVFNDNNSNTDNTIVILNSANEKSLNRQKTEMAEKIGQYIEQTLEATVTIGIGTVVNNIEKLNESYNNAKLALDYRFLLGTNKIIRYQDIIPETSIQSIIAFFFSSLFINIFLITGFFAYNLTEDTAIKNSMNYTLKIIENVIRNIHSYIGYMKNISSIVITNKDVLDYYSNYNKLTEQSRKNYQAKISNFLISILQARRDINLILLAGYNGGFISNREIDIITTHIIIEEREWYSKARSESGNIVISPSHIQDILKDKYRWVVSLSMEFKSDNEPLGILLIDLNFNVIENLCEEIFLEGLSYLFIVDSNGGIVYHPRHQLIYSELKTELIDEVIDAENTSFIINDGPDSRIYTVKTIEQLGWKICGVTYLNELVTNKNFIQFYFSLIGIIFILLIIIISIFISGKISKPIKYLQASMKEVESDNFNMI